MSKTRLGIFAAILVAVEILLIGIPVRYDYELYDPIEGVPTLAGAEFVVQLQESKGCFLLTVPLCRGGPYSVSLRVQGRRGDHESLVVRSVRLRSAGSDVPSEGGSAEALAPFGGTKAWYATPDLATRFEPEFAAIEHLTLEFDAELRGVGGSRTVHVVRSFQARRSAGWSFLSLWELARYE